jgi:purine-binding chemotaxis protein CheW
MDANQTAGQEGKSSTSQYLTFQLAGETYSVPLYQVQEIRTYSPTTRIPNTPHYVIGVVNLRGAIIAMIDLRARLNMESISEDEQTIVVVVNVRGQTYGLRADSVSDVIEVASNQVQEAPKVTSDDQQRFIAGLAQVQERVLILLDLDRVVGTEAELAMAA